MAAPLEKEIPNLETIISSGYVSFREGINLYFWTSTI